MHKNNIFMMCILLYFKFCKKRPFDLITRLLLGIYDKMAIFSVL